VEAKEWVDERFAPEKEVRGLLVKKATILATDEERLLLFR